MSEELLARLSALEAENANLRASQVQPNATTKVEGELLSEEELGDRKPSQFLRHLKSLAGPTFTDDNILRQLWLRRLPQHVQGILAAQADLGLERIADIADKIVEAQPATANVCATAAAPSLTTLMEQIEELRKQVAALSSTRTGRFRSRDRSSSRRRQSSRNTTYNARSSCWYHKKYGTKANKCVTPCNWESENPPSNQ
ncbi:uncharacterized protein LOC119190677 [Manduca sexta]|uniref:uncharacterized protein LOC119190677 n=1 Tax=Manduca sexta TaxID=7130 RepID=UPI00188E4E50|nr:uncharacterized protein LOC119190677 [Manduca sexta]